jgi:HlyD family secretion protein
MQLTLIGKVKNPYPWMLGLMAASVSAVGTTYFIVNRATPKLNIAELTVPVQSKNLTQKTTASGTLVPIQNVNLSPKQAGQLKALYVDQGDRVQQGQIVARMDDSDLQAQLLEARGNLEQAQAQLALARAGNRKQDIVRALAEVEAARAKEKLAFERRQSNGDLYHQGAISKDKLDEVLSDERSARANLLSAQQNLSAVKSGSRPEEIAKASAAVTTASGQLRAIQVQLSNTIIRAPFSGVVTQKYASLGAFVTPTTSASSTASATSSSIVAIARGLEILVKVPEVSIGQIKQGQSVEIVADAYPNQVFKGHVKLIAPEAVVENNVTSFQVRVALTTGQGKLRSGMNVDVTFLGDQLQNALVVPTVAIVTQNGQTGVLVTNADNTKATFNPVAIGPTIGNQIQILKGVQGGERVFVDLPKDQINDSNQSQPILKAKIGS